jgi:hypothetical protein
VIENYGNRKFNLGLTDKLSKFGGDAQRGMWNFGGGGSFAVIAGLTPEIGCCRFRHL